MSKDMKDYLHYYLGCEVQYDGILNGKELKEELQANKHDIFYTRKVEERKGMKTGLLKEIRYNKSGFAVCYVGNKSKKGYLGAGANNIKPILRPLSDMTEDEAADVYMIERDRILHSPTNDVDVRQRTDFGWVVTRLDHLNIGLLIKYDGVCYKVINEGKRPTIEPAMNQPLIFHYLLSKHFDLFGLIESGLAISKTKQGI